MIRALIVNPDIKNSIIRQRLQKLGVQCDVLFNGLSYSILDYDDKINYQKVYFSLEEIINCSNNVNYQLVIAGSPLAKDYCKVVVEKLQLQGIIISDEPQTATGYRHSIVSWR